MEPIITQLAQELDQNPQYVANVVRLLDEGNTIPFIARYRKELHGAMDDTTLRNLEERLNYLRGLQERRETVKNAIAEQGKLTEELSRAIDGAATLAEVEDLYRPYKQKRRTRATMAREKGLAPLAELLFAQGRDCPDPLEEAAGRRLRTPWRGPPTSWRRPSATTRSCGRPSGNCCPKTESSTARPPWRRIPSTGSITTSPARSPRCRGTRSWLSTGGRRRGS